MKKVLVFLTFSFLSFSCATTFNAALLKPTAGSINPLLPRLKMQQNAQAITSATGKEVTSNTYMYTIFERELENLCQQKGDYRGTIEPIITINSVDMGGWGWFIASSCLLYIPNLFGFPFCSQIFQLECEFEIKDGNGDRVWKKTYIEREKKVYSFYSKLRSDEQTLIMYRKIILDFKRDLQNDVGIVSENLSK